MSGTLYPQHQSEYHIYPNRNPSYWIIVGVMFLMDIYVVFLSVSLINPVKQFLKTAEKKPKLTVVGSAVVNCLFSLSAVLLTVSTVLVLLSSDFGHHLLLNEVFAKTGLSVYMLSQTLLILLFIVRIDETFKGSQIQYSKLCITSLYISAFLFFVFYVFFMIYFILEQWYMFAIFAVIWIVLYFGLSGTLCILFVRKIEVLIIHFSNDHHMDEALLYVVIKHAILVPILIGTSLICLILFIMVEYAVTPGEWIPSSVFWTVFDCMMSSSGLFLLFAWNNKYYDKWCAKPHYFCEKRDILQLEKSHNTTVAKRKQSAQSRTNLSVTGKTGSAHTSDIPSSQATASIHRTLDLTSTTGEDTPKNKKVERQSRPSLILVESIKRLSLREMGSSNRHKFKALGSRLMDDDAIAVSVNGNDCSEIDRKRMQEIEAIQALEDLDP